jgi:alpha-galactosidase
LPTSFEPLTSRLFDIFGYLPVPGDQHLCEYMPWLSDPMTKPWEKYNVSLYDWGANAALRQERLARIARMGAGEESVDALRAADSEGALEVIENLAGASNHYHLAVNIPNRGYIANLPENALVEVPGLMSGAGIQGVGIGCLPEAVAELCRRELAVVRLCVDAAVRGDRQAALQCLLLDPVVRDIEVARQILDDYLTTYRQYLPQFWS